MPLTPVTNDLRRRLEPLGALHLDFASSVCVALSLKVFYFIFLFGCFLLLLLSIFFLQNLLSQTTSNEAVGKPRLSKI